jgi:hypothetical protein
LSVLQAVEVIPPGAGPEIGEIVVVPPYFIAACRKNLKCVRVEELSC